MNHNQIEDNKQKNKSNTWANEIYGRFCVCIGDLCMNQRKTEQVLKTQLLGINLNFV